MRWGRLGIAFILLGSGLSGCRWDLSRRRPGSRPPPSKAPASAPATGRLEDSSRFHGFLLPGEGWEFEWDSRGELHRFGRLRFAGDEGSLRFKVWSLESRALARARAQGLLPAPSSQSPGDEVFSPQRVPVRLSPRFEESFLRRAWAVPEISLEGGQMRASFSLQEVVFYLQGPAHLRALVEAFTFDLLDANQSAILRRSPMSPRGLEPEDQDSGRILPSPTRPLGWVPDPESSSGVALKPTPRPPPSRGPLPSRRPTRAPVPTPTRVLTRGPTPTLAPTRVATPSRAPTQTPTELSPPTPPPTRAPSVDPTPDPTEVPPPTRVPSVDPTPDPTRAPTWVPTPTELPTELPPTPAPTALPTWIPNPTPTPVSTLVPTEPSPPTEPPPPTLRLPPPPSWIPAQPPTAELDPGTFPPQTAAERQLRARIYLRQAEQARLSGKPRRSLGYLEEARALAPELAREPRERLLEQFPSLQGAPEVPTPTPAPTVPVPTRPAEPTREPTPTRLPTLRQSPDPTPAPSATSRPPAVPSRIPPPTLEPPPPTPSSTRPESSWDWWRPILGELGLLLVVAAFFWLLSRWLVGSSRPRRYR